MTTNEEQETGWETESGLVDDVDAWIRNPRFGTKEEYAEAVIAAPETQGVRGLMLLVDLEDEAGEIIGNSGWSVGTGWNVSDDGLTITHAKRKNVVTATLYGQLQNRVVKELGVNMADYGLPTDALSWDGLGFHWMQQTHATVGVTKSGQKEATGLMPTAFLGVKGEVAEEPPPVAAPAARGARVAAPARRTAPARAARPAAAVSAGEQAAINLVADCGTAKEFVLKAMKLPEITGDDALMAQCLDDGATGFFATHKGK